MRAYVYKKSIVDTALQAKLKGSPELGVIPYQSHFITTKRLYLQFLNQVSQ